MRGSALAVVCGVVFIDLLGFGLILPLLPYYAEGLGATGTWVGVLLTAYSAAQFLGAPALGALSDRFGRRSLLLFSLAGSALSLALTGLADSLVLLLAARLLAGLFGGSISVAQAYVADLTEAGQRTRAMGLLGAAIGLGFVFGPALGAGLAPYGFGAAAFAAAGLAAANLLLGWFTLPESRRPGTKPASRRRARSLAGLRAALRRPQPRPILVAGFLTMFAFTSMEATFALLGQQRFGLGAAGLGVVFTYAGVVLVMVQGGLVGQLAARYGDRHVAVAGALLMGGALAMIPTSPAVVAYGAVGLLAAGQGLLTPTLTSLLSRTGGDSNQGSLLGVGQSMAAAARGIGPLCAGVLFDHGSALPYVLGATLAIIAAWTVARTAPSRIDVTLEAATVAPSARQ